MSYWLGEIVKTHIAGADEITEYHPRVSNGGVLTKEIDESKTLFSVQGHSYDTLGAAVTFSGLMQDGVNVNTARMLLGVIQYGAGGEA